MKKLIGIAILTTAALVLTSAEASAWKFPLLPCKCCKNICCTQYNAFSPFCCDGMPMNGGGHGPMYPGAAPAWNFTGDGGYMGQLPAGQEMAGSANAYSPGAPPVAAMPIYNGPPATPGAAGPGRSWNAWGPNMVYPNGAPSYYPPGFGGYAPSNGMGR